MTQPREPLRAARRLVLAAAFVAGCDDTVFLPHAAGGGAPIGDGPFCETKAVFDAYCVSCHTGGENAVGGLDLAADPVAALVGVESPTYPGRIRVVAGDSEASFLIDKLEGTQGDAGGQMPPTGALPAESIAAVREWIDGGASGDCSGGDTGAPSNRYHPENFADASQHGIAAKYQQLQCVTCHGEDLAGGSVGISCDGCHPGDTTDAWRTNCTFCHGGTDNETGAPPVDIDNRTEDLSFAAHTSHVEETIHSAWDCTQCHTKPTSVLSSGHLFLDDTTKGRADVTFAAGLSHVATYDADTLTCSNLYCHGDGRADNGTITTTSASLGCDGCHAAYTSGEGGWDTMSGRHDDHLAEAGLVCGDCHGATVSGTDTLVGVANHVDGDVDLTLGSVTYSAGDCTGSCHGYNHDDRSW